MGAGLRWGIPMILADVPGESVQKKFRHARRQDESKYHPGPMSITQLSGLLFWIDLSVYEMQNHVNEPWALKGS